MKEHVVHPRLHLLRPTDQVADDPGHDVGGPRRVVEGRPGFVTSGSGSGVAGNVTGAGAEEHVDAVAPARIVGTVALAGLVEGVLLVEVEPVGHAEEMTKGES